MGMSDTIITLLTTDIFLSSKSRLNLIGFLRESHESHHSRITLSTAIFITVVIFLPMKVATSRHSMDDVMAFYVFNTRFESSASITQKGNVVCTK